jgi:hypothetical protein
MTTGKRENNAISRAADYVGTLTFTNDVATTPVIPKENYAGLSGVRISGSPTSLTFYVSNGSQFRELTEDYYGNADAFVAPEGIWAFAEVKIVANVTSVYEIRLAS